ncbi:MAG: nitrogen fixation protein NifH [Chloroflexota bacterium]
MSWQDQLKGDSLSWLLETETPGVQYLALRGLLECSETDSELRAARKAAHKEGPIATVLAEMDKTGYWVKPGPGYTPKFRSTVWSIVLLAQLGACVEEDKRIAQACAYLMDHAFTDGGQFTRSGAPSGTIDCLQGNLSWALLELGYDDPRLEMAFDWMARSVTGEGVAPAKDHQATVRYYAGKCGPTFACGYNNRLPCAWGCVKVMLALGKWSKKRRTPLVKRAIQQGVDFLFSVDPASAAYPMGTGTRPSQNWWKFGFPVFYAADLLLLVESLVAVGHGNDPRLSRALALIREKQDAHGRWALEHDFANKTWVDFGAKKQPNKWVTLRALRVLKAVDAG